MLSRTNTAANLVIDLSSIGNNGIPQQRPRGWNTTGWRCQAIEFMMEFICLNSVSLAFSLTGRRLSAGIYKICTLLSTSFVENIAEADPGVARQALSGAVFRARTRAHW
ncbi:MAG: hypothetical protein ACM3QY_09480 [Candidatus Levyibacteriota bacterium]